MDFRHCLAGLLALAGAGCESGPAPAGTNTHMVFSLGGRVAVVAVEATAAARRADRGTTAAAVGLIAALGRSDDNLGLVLFGEEAAALRTVTSMALKRARPPGVEDDMDLPPLRGPASTAAALSKAQTLLERFNDRDESTVVWLGATAPDDEMALLAPTIDMFGGRGWRILVAPTADADQSPVLDELAAGTRGARFATDGGKALLRGVLELAADLHVLFRRVDPVDAPVRAPEAARRLMFVALTGPGSDLVGARTADKTGEPVWNPWVRRPADGEPPYRVLELSDPLSLQTRTWSPRVVGTPAVDAYVEMPLRVILAPGAPPIEIEGGAAVPVRMIVELAEGAQATLPPRLTADAAFGTDEPVVLQPETAAEGALAFSALVHAPGDVSRPTLTLRLQLEDPQSGTWVWTRRLQMRATLTGPSPLDVDPPELDLGPGWDDAPKEPAPIVLRARQPLHIVPESSGPLEVAPAALEVAADGEATLTLALARGTAPGPVQAQVSLRVQDATGRDLAARLVPVTGTVVHWGAPPPIAFGPRKPGESASLLVPAVWTPVPADALVAGFLEGPEGARIELTGFAETDGGVTIAALVPDTAPVGHYAGDVVCGAPGLEPRRVAATLEVSTDGTAAPAGGPPVIEAIEPPTGPVHGGNRITIRGSEFAAAAVVRIGGQPAEVNHAEPTALIVTVPEGTAAGVVDVEVVNPGGASALQMGGYTYDDAAVIPTAAPFVAEPPLLELAGFAGTEVRGEVRVANATEDRLPNVAECSDLRSSGGGDLISARFDCAADVVAPADGKPALVRYRVRLPADLASGRYAGTLVLRDKVSGDAVEVRVEVEVP